MTEPIRPAPALAGPVGPFSIIIREWATPPRQIGPFATLADAMIYGRGEYIGPGGQIWINDGQGRRLPVDPKQ